MTDTLTPTRAPTASSRKPANVSKKKTAKKKTTKKTSSAPAVKKTEPVVAEPKSPAAVKPVAKPASNAKPQAIENPPFEKPEAPSVEPLRRDRFMLAQHGRQEFEARIPEGTPVERCLDPAFWANTAQAYDIQPYAEFRLLAEDGSWMAKALVVSVYARGIVIQILDYYPLAVTTEVPKISLFTVAYKGPHHLHAIIDKHSGTIMLDGFANKQEALKNLADYERSAVG